MMRRVPPRHLNGAVHIRLVEPPTLDIEGYFKRLQIVSPLFTESGFRDATPGFYINYIKDDDRIASGALRLVYFTTDNVKTIKAIDEFVGKNSDRIHLFEGAGAYNTKDAAALIEVNGQSLSFWNSVNDSTQIVLDLLSSLGRIPVHQLMYHYGTVCLPRGTRPQDFFEPVFVRHSPYFVELRNQSLAETYWADLTKNFDEGFPLHFPLNMVLGPYENVFKHLLMHIADKRE